jgi:ATP dependent DNA ligase C terminal region
MQPSSGKPSGTSLPRPTARPSSPLISMPAPATPAPADCPRCGGRLVNPESLGLCPACGYCHTLHADAAEPESAIDLAKNTVAGESAVAFCQMMRVLPKWAWVTLSGMAFILGGSLAADALLPTESFARAVWSSTQLVVGLVLVLGTQIYGVIRLSVPTSSLEGREFFLFSPRLWRRIFKELPATRWLVYLESWGLALTICAIVIVGNLLYWLQNAHPREYADQDLRKAAEARELGKETGESKIFVPGGSNLTELPTGDLKQDSRPSVQCAIIGYVPDEDGLPTALVLARLNEGKLVYCGTVKRGFLPKEAEELREILSKSVRAEPLIKGLQKDAVWVKAGAYCDVHQSGFDAAGHLIDPSYDRLRK